MKKLFYLVALISALSFNGTAQVLPPVSNDWTDQRVLHQPAGETNRMQIDGDRAGNLTATWSVSQVSGSSSHRVGYYAHSSDGGLTWTDAEEVVPMGPERTADRYGVTVGVGANDTWLMSVLIRDEVPPYQQYYGIVRSHDAGRSWGSFVDLTSNFPLIEGDNGQVQHLTVGYGGEGAWILMLSTSNSVRYVRSTDNGETWGNTVYLHRNTSYDSAEVYGAPGAPGVAIGYRNYDLPGDPHTVAQGSRVVIFSTDGGQTFGTPALLDIVAADTNGNWLGAKWQRLHEQVGVNQFRVTSTMGLKYSADGGQTFFHLPDPPDLYDELAGLQRFRVDSLEISSNGQIVITGTAYVGTVFVLPHSGFTTRSSDFGQTWTPWKRLQEETDAPTQGVAASGNDFVALMAGAVNGSSAPALYSVRLDAAAVTSAADWQLYQ